MLDEIENKEELGEELGENKLDTLDDPGSQEGLDIKKEDKEVYGKKVEKRIDTLTKNWRGTERELSASKERESQKDDEIKLLIEQNRNLMEVIKEGKRGDDSGGDRGRNIDPEALIKTEMKDVNDRIKAARVKLDWDTVDALEEKLDDLRDQLVNVKVKKGMWVVSKEVKSNIKDDSTLNNEDAVRVFTRENDWFNPNNDKYDPLMRGAALEYDDYLLTQPKWKDKPLSERLKETKKVIEERFGKKSSNAGGPTQVEGSKVDTSKGGGKTEDDYGLNETEKRIALKLIGLPNPRDCYKEYANQKKIK